MIHTLFSVLFVLAFVSALGLFAAGVVLKERHLLRWGAWGFVICFGFLSVVYLSGFSEKAALLLSAPELVKQAAEKHHRMSKFVLTGLILITAACAFVLSRYRNQEYPAWFRANTLFIALTLLVFLLRSLITGFGIGWTAQKVSLETALQCLD